MLVVAIPSIAPYSSDGVVGRRAIYVPVSSCRCLLVMADSSCTAGRLSHTHSSLIHLPLPFHRQHEHGIETDTKLQVA